MSNPFTTPQTKAERIIQAIFLAFATGMVLQKYFPPMFAFPLAIAVVIVLYILLHLIFSKVLNNPSA